MYINLNTMHHKIKMKHINSKSGPILRPVSNKQLVILHVPILHYNLHFTVYICF